MYIVLNTFLLNYYFGHSLSWVIIEDCMVKGKHKPQNSKSYPIKLLYSHFKGALFVHTDTREVPFLTLFSPLRTYIPYTHFS